MSLRQKVRLEYDADGETRDLVVEYSAVDLRAWEGEFRQSLLNARLSITILTWLGHHAAVRQGKLDGQLKDYAAFDQVCESVAGVADDPPTKAEGKGAKATRKAASAASSAR